MSPPMASEQVRKTRLWSFADRLGTLASFLCAIHCAALPFVLSILPFVGLSFLADHTFERGFVLFASALAAFALGSGFRRHRRPLPLLLALPGLLLLTLGVTYAENVSIVLHSVMVTCGGLLVAAGHFTNLRIERQVGHAGHSHAH